MFELSILIDLDSQHNFCKRKSFFSIVMQLFDFHFYNFSINKVGILLFAAKVFNRQVSSARLCTNIIQNRGIPSLPKISSIQSQVMILASAWGHEPPKYGNFTFVWYCTVKERAIYCPQLSYRSWRRDFSC